MQNKPQIFTLTNGRVHVKDIYVEQPVESAKKILLEHTFTMDSESGNIIEFKGYLGSLGLCKLKIWTKDYNTVGGIYISTEKRFTEEEMMEVFEQLKVELHGEPGYDYNGYGVSPKPHEVDHFWDLDEGLVSIRWDGYNVSMFSHNQDGADKINLEVLGPVVKDEVYWRSEVD